MLAGPERRPAASATQLRSITPDYATPEGVHPRALRRAVQHAVESYVDLRRRATCRRAWCASWRCRSPRRRCASSTSRRSTSISKRCAPAPRAAHTRLVLEELYLLELGLALRREGRAREPAIAIDGGGRRASETLASLPFRLTRAQARVWGEVRADLARPHPMQRLLEGDVGSGKTVIALLAAVAVAEAGCQTALMAPTELLAEQHERTLRRLARGERGVGSAAHRAAHGLRPARGGRAGARAARRRRARSRRGHARAGAGGRGASGGSRWW